MDSENSNLKSQLRDAVVLRNVEAVCQILSEHPELCHSSGSQINAASPLWMAMLLGYEDIVEKLLEFGAHADEWIITENKKLTFFHFLATDSPSCPVSLEVAKVLVRHGANVNLTYYPSQLPIQLAIVRGNPFIVEFFLKNGARLEGFEWHSISPIFMVLETPDENKVVILHLLIRYGVNIRFLGEYGDNILHTLVGASSQKNCDVREMIEVLLAYEVPLDEISDAGFSPLEFSIFLGNFQLTKFLIQKGAIINKKNIESSISPLNLAAKIRDFDIVNLLVSSGADVNFKTSDGRTSLHEACDSCSNEIIKFLLQKGADLSAEDNFGRTPLALLNFENHNYDDCLTVMIKEFSKLDFENQLISKKNKNFIEADLKLKNLLENCKRELALMKSTVFFSPYSYYSVLLMSKNIKKLANLTINENFVQNFKNKLSFSYYEDNLREIFEEAIQLKDRILTVRSRLYSVFNDILPTVVINKLAKYITAEDLPIE